MNVAYKKAFFVIGICLVLVLVGIYTKGKGGRYEIIGAENGVQVYDLKTNSIYYHSDTEVLWHRVDSQGCNTQVKELPQ